MNSIPEQPRLALAPMEGLADDILRDVLTRVGGYDFAVSEFARVSGSRLPAKTFRRISPELLNGGRTRAGTPVRVQILGSDPVSMAESAASLAALDPPAIDLNFGCPTPTVNRHRGGAILLDEPELLYRIVAAVRQNVHVPVTAKMRLGVSDTAKTLDCARALCAGGASEIVVHARTKAQMYRPPADWAWIARIAETVPVPVIANGEVWTVDDYRRCRAESGVAHVMLGRGAVADPFLAQRIRQEVIDTKNGNTSSVDGGASWADMQPLLSIFWQGVIGKVLPRHAPGRLKMWLGYLARRYPEAAQLSAVIRRLRHVEEITHWLHTGI